ncbi:hypothetical protein TNCT_62891 [Trichonephila clavata]|uniref:Uncharacterized protein n=1 Tax=Trichonephila clavata TaxID=2740835 RepID=A0A8X6LU00_TRICU|nr:hypothetical protein TNCT_62891 [Trichonephila clavata]
MALLFHLEIFYYLAICTSATLVKGYLPTFIDILGYVSLIEMIKVSFLLSFEGLDMQRGILFPERKKRNSSVPEVNSLMIFKVCESLGINVQLAPEERRLTLIKKYIKRTEKDYNTPEVKSEMVYHICKALNIDVVLSTLSEDTEELIPEPKEKKPLPIVRSVMLHKICQALSLNTGLNTAAEFPDFKIPKKMKKETIPIVQSETIFKFCEALNLKVALANSPQDLK